MKSRCCGGGGNLETTDRETASLIAQRKIDDIKEIGAEMVVSACQQCLRTLATRAIRQKVDLEVLDITELVCRAMGTN